MSQNNFILKVLRIKDPNIQVSAVEESFVNFESIITITARLSYPVDRCIYKKVVKNGYRKAHVRLDGLNGV